jgi:hypothetical protein
MIFFCEGGFTRGDAIFARGQVDAARAISMSPVKMDDKCTVMRVTNLCDFGVSRNN